MPPTIRAAKPEDSAPILELMVAVIRATTDHAHQSDTIENVSSNLDYWTNNPGQCVHLVAENKTSIIGVILIKDYWNLCSLFVDVEHHRQGIGRVLTQAATDMCRGRSPMGAIFLNSSPFAVAFYSALGFGPRETKQPLHPGVKPMKYDLAPLDD
jgi:GNAT superfamily N-acetyltransferase